MAVLLGRLGRYATNTVSRKTDPKERRGSVLNLFLTLQKQVKKDGLSNRPLAKLLASLPSGLLPSPDQDKFNRTQADIQNGTAGMKITDSSLYKSSESNSRAADEADDSFEIYNAGLVVLAQFLPLFFDALGLLEDKSFSTEQSAVRGAQILQFICTCSTEMPEQDMILNKILCGLPIDTPLPGTLHISNYEKEEVDNLLASVIEHWKALKGTSAKGLRQTFLNRTGMIKIENNGWSIFIERTTVDVLLDHLPWSISIIKLPWNDKFIHVEW